MAGDSEGSEEVRHVSWDNPNTDVLADLKAVEEWMLNMCNLCGGQRWLPTGKYPYWIRCPGCTGSGLKPRKNEHEATD